MQRIKRRWRRQRCLNCEMLLWWLCYQWWPRLRIGVSIPKFFGGILLSYELGCFLFAAFIVLDALLEALDTDICWLILLINRILTGCIRNRNSVDIAEWRWSWIGWSLFTSVLHLTLMTIWWSFLLALLFCSLLLKLLNLLVKLRYWWSRRLALCLRHHACSCFLSRSLVVSSFWGNYNSTVVLSCHWRKTLI